MLSIGTQLDPVAPVWTTDDFRRLIAAAAFVGFLAVMGQSFRAFAEYDPLTEYRRGADLRGAIERHPCAAKYRSK